MTETDKLYYKEMLEKGRLIPFFKNDELILIISFYITNNPDRYIQRDNPWSVLDDEPETGKVFYIDQVWSDKNRRDQFQVWKRLLDFISHNYPLVQTIRWNRWKNDKVYIFNKTVKRSMKNV